MKKIFMKCFIGTLTVSVLVMVANYFLKIDVVPESFMRSAAIFFVLIVCSEILRDKAKKNQKNSVCKLAMGHVNPAIVFRDYSTPSNTA